MASTAAYDSLVSKMQRKQKRNPSWAGLAAEYAGAVDRSAPTKARVHQLYSPLSTKMQEHGKEAPSSRFDIKYTTHQEPMPREKLRFETASSIQRYFT